jgi:hypothetical protein
MKSRLIRIAPFWPVPLLLFVSLLLAPVSRAQQRPTIVLNPVGKTDVPEGDSFTFNSQAVGTAPLIYQWVKNLAPIAGATSPALALTSLKLSDSGNYRVIATNMYGAATSTVATLTVQSKAPVLLKQPHTAVLQPGEITNLVVTATGAPPLTYQWYINGNVVSGANQRQLQVIAPSFGEDDIYTVVISNAYGSVTSDPAGIIGGGVIPPTIESQPPLSISFTFGESVSLSVVAVGSRPISYQWYKDDKPVPGATSPTLKLGANGFFDSGEYYALVINIMASARSTTTAVSFIADGVNAPKIIADPQSYTNSVEGSSLNLSISATGNEPLTYQWYRKPLLSPEESFRLIPGATAASLTIATTVSWLDSAFYEALVSNTYGGATSAVATIIVRPKMSSYAYINGGGHWETFAEGAPLSLVVHVGPFEAVYPLAYQWYKDGTLLAGATKQEFAISQASLIDSGVYSCVVSNAYGTVTSGAEKVTVLPTIPKFISESPAQANLVAGQPFTLTFSVMGADLLGAKWYQNSTVVQEQRWGDCCGTDHTDYSLSRLWAPHDSGDYVLVVSNKFAFITSQVVHVEVHLSTPHEKRPTSSSLPDVRHGLVAYWPFDEFVDNKTPDVVGGYDLYLPAQSTQEMYGWNNQAHRGGALTVQVGLPGISRTNASNDELPINKHREFTFSGWCLIDRGDVNFGSLPTIFEEASTQDQSLLFSIGFQPYYLPAVLKTEQQPSLPVVTVQTLGSAASFVSWHHLALVQEADGRRWFYLDGREDETNLPQKDIGQWNLDITRLGAWEPLPAGTVAAEFCCSWPYMQVDDVALWKRALTAEEINLVMNSGIPGFPELAIESISYDPGSSEGKLTWRGLTGSVYSVLNSSDLAGHWAVLGKQTNYFRDYFDPVSTTVTNSVRIHFSTDVRGFYQLTRVPL